MIRETTAPQDIVWLKIDDIYPYECNNKIHRQPEITKIANSIKEFGWTYPILIDENNIILAGHKRLLASKQLGLTEVPTIQKSDLTDAQKRAYRIIDNKSSEESEYDPTNLTLELDEIKALDFDISKFINLNFDLDKIGEIQDLDVQEDNYDAEQPAEPKTKYGDIYQLGNHRLMCGDSTKEEDVEKMMNGEKAEMVFTDMPYGMGLNTDYSSLNWKGRKGKKYEQGKVDDFSPQMVDNLFNCFGYVEEIFLWGADYFAEFLPNKNNGSWIVWDKTLESNGDAGSNSEFELCWSKQKHKREVIHFNWFRYFGLSKQDVKTRIHPTQKPIQVITPFLNKYTKDENIVVDLFGGSGSTLIACEQLNRKCYMMELDPAYCDVIIDRWEKFTGQKAQKIEE